MTPEQRLADAFVALAGSTADTSSDVPGPLSVLAHRAPALLGTRAAAVVFTPEDYDGARVVGSNPQVSHLEHEAVGWREGPGYDCHHPDAGPWAQAAFDNSRTRRRWPHYTPQALSLGYSHVVALPLGEHTRTSGASGALILLSCAGRTFSPETLVLGRSLADFTAVILESAREADRSRTLAAQLERALTSRVVIEQAKGVLATRRTVTPDEAFDLLRKYARSRQRPLRDVAREVVEGHADPELTDRES
ncbi:ANTAR domain-containing response regulator [Streptomyces sp. NPDC050528]|uniref:ANTAR domain-containing response regulator n=1 Tax=Streptomyces sp. NPDC050528 TaxID=3365623 RepID=UPI0037A4AEEF